MHIFLWWNEPQVMFESGLSTRLHIALLSRIKIVSKLHTTTTTLHRIIGAVSLVKN